MDDTAYHRLNEQIKRPIRPVRSTRPPRPSNRIPAKPHGPQWTQRMRKRRIAGGPGEPPPGFVSATTSGVEWLYYWALAKIFQDPADPRQPPYWGGEQWGYQLPFDGGNRITGGVVGDFVVYYNDLMLVLRVQTERFHIFGSAKQQAYDAKQKVDLAKSGEIVVVDLYPQYVLHDPSGQALIAQVKQALGMIEQSNPISTGYARRVRNRLY